MLAEINVRPRQAQCLRDPQPGRHEERPERPVDRVAGAFDEEAGLVGVEDGALAVSEWDWSRKRCDIANQ